MKEVITPSYVNMSYIITCCLICISLHYLKQPTTFFRGCILSIISILLTFIVDITSHFITSFDIKNIIIFLIPVILGIIIGLFTLIKFRVQNYPFYVNLLCLLCSFVCYITITCDFLTPTLFDTENKPERQKLYLLYVEVCVGMLTSVISLFGHFSIILKLGHFLPERKVNVPFRSFFLIFALILSIIMSSFIILVNDNTAKMTLYFIVSVIVGICSFVGVIVDTADLSIMMGLLQSILGWSIVAIGFIRENNAVVFCGSIIGMYCIITMIDLSKAKNMSIVHLIFSNGESTDERKRITRRIDIPQIDVDELKRIAIDSNTIVIIPSHAIVNSHSQMLLVDLISLLKQKNKTVKIAIHPTIEVMGGFMEMLMILGHVESEALCSFDINEEMDDVDLVIVCDDCRMTPYSKAEWRKFETTKALHSVVVSERQIVEQNEQNVFWLNSSIDYTFTHLVDALKHEIY